jgi:hypothetical protein
MDSPLDRFVTYSFTRLPCPSKTKRLFAGRISGINGGLCNDAMPIFRGCRRLTLGLRSYDVHPRLIGAHVGLTGEFAVGRAGM